MVWGKLKLIMGLARSVEWTRLEWGKVGVRQGYAQCWIGLDKLGVVPGQIRLRLKIR